MEERKIPFYCPHCNQKREVFYPGKFKCSNCGCKFRIDSNQRMTSFEYKDGELSEIFQPNKIPWKTRFYYLLASSFLFVYGLAGLINDDIYIPGKRSRGIHLHGYAAVIMFIVFLLAIANMVSVVIDHFDKRDNEVNYKYFAKVTSIFAWMLFFAALIAQIVLDLD